MTAIWVAFLGATLASSPGDLVRYVLDDGVYPLGVVVAAVMSLFALRRGPRERRQWWALTLAGNVAWATADGYWCWNDAWQHPVDGVSIGDALLILSYLLQLIAIGGAFAGSGGLRQWRGQLDGALVATAVGLAGWQLMVSPRLHTGLTANSVVLAVYPLLDVAFFMVFVSVGLSGRRRLPLPVLLVVIGNLWSVLGDLAVAVAGLRNLTLDDGLVKAVYLPMILLMILGATIDARRSTAEQAVERSLAYDPGNVPVLVAVAGVLLWAGRDALAGRIGAAALIASATMIIGLTVRSHLTLRDHRRVARELDAALAEQRRLAITDGLTGIYNRRFGEELLQLESERAVREAGSVSIVLVDLDHFKSVNDTYGHEAGDAVLIQSTVRFNAVLRSTDVLIRWGGEEFLAVLPGMDGHEAAEVGERLRRVLSDRPLQLPSGQRIGATASFGIASVTTATFPPEAVLQAADEALYAAKTAGRNRVVRAGAAAGQPDLSACPAA
ncbi:MULTISPECIES: GGDEF domain-containing protein [unclassified Actinoplanes]|uniref:GGDEF domain-containing protein n=1 Tax=unclassified Actinoplanes TaxID=2626549 RepID=UPI000305C15D|nr:MULTISPECIES: GGDEF domain-containing protein [unclassified Actinoplanes]